MDAISLSHTFSLRGQFIPLIKASPNDPRLKIGVVVIAQVLWMESGGYHISDRQIVTRNSSRDKALGVEIGPKRHTSYSVEYSGGSTKKKIPSFRIRSFMESSNTDSLREERHQHCLGLISVKSDAAVTGSRSRSSPNTPLSPDAITFASNRRQYALYTAIRANKYFDAFLSSGDCSSFSS